MLRKIFRKFSHSPENFFCTYCRSSFESLYRCFSLKLFQKFHPQGDLSTWDFFSSYIWSSFRIITYDFCCNSSRSSSWEWKLLNEFLAKLQKEALNMFPNVFLTEIILTFLRHYVGNCSLTYSMVWVKPDHNSKAGFKCLSEWNPRNCLECNGNVMELLNSWSNFEGIGGAHEELTGRTPGRAHEEIPRDILEILSEKLLKELVQNLTRIAEILIDFLDSGHPLPLHDYMHCIRQSELDCLYLVISLKTWKFHYFFDKNNFVWDSWT